MNPAQLLSHFDRISDAPDAIPRLRQFILDLAVRGKLVEQDPRDEPAAELLKRIQAEKEWLVKTGEIRKQEPARLIDKEEEPFEVPPGWCWVRLIDVLTKLTDGTHHSPTNLADGDFKYITAKNIKSEGISLVEISYVTAKVHHEIYARCNPKKGDILYIKDGATTGIVTINDLDEPFSMLSSVALLKLSSHIYNRLIVEFLRSPFFYMQMRGFMKGAAITRVTLKRMAPALIPLPPLAEQHRIVAKVDELMALCDRLEATQRERESRRDRLVASSLHRLNNGADPDAFHDHARFYFNCLPRLTTKPEHIQQLRHIILNLAVRGKLVPQDPNDESASELLNRIQAEKTRLLKEGKICAEKPPIPARVDELVFELKPGWQVARISQILVELQTGPFGSSLHQSDYQMGGIPVINPASIKDERLVPVESMAVGSGTLKRLSTFKLRAGDIVMARRGEMGRCAVVTEHEDGWLCGTGSLILRLPTCVSPRFLVTLIGSPFVREYLGGLAVGATMQNLNQSILLNLVIGLPPLAEQHRIVAKVDELMALCDQLEAQLATTHTDSRLLLEAVLHEALAPAV